MLILNEVYDRFCKKLDEVNGFMQFMKAHEAEARMGSWQTVSYNAIIISLYGNLERFADEIGEAYVDKVFSILRPYSNLPKIMRERHETISGEFLSSPNRFVNYGTTNKEVIKNLYDCIFDSPTANLNKRMILRHGGNLKSSELIRVFQNLGIEDFRTIVVSDVFVSEYAREKGFSYDDAKNRIGSLLSSEQGLSQIFMELDTLVDQRNQVAHSGRVDNMLSLDAIQTTMIPFLRLVGRVITQKLVSKILELYNQQGLLIEIPMIYNVIRNGQVILLNRGGLIFQVGDSIVVGSSSGEYHITTIEEIQIDNHSIHEVRDKDGTNVGIRVQDKVSEKSKLFLIHE